METLLPDEWDDWLAEGERLLSAPPLRRSDQSARGFEDPKFALGDFLTNIPLDLVERLAEDLDSDPAQFRIYREVALKVPADRRVKASWTVHRDLRDRLDLLRDGLTVRQAVARAGKRQIDSKADQNLSVEERAAKVRAFLADPEVYALIEQEMTRSRADRKVRHGARLVHEELTKKEKAAQAELRERREAKSPLEATLKAQIDVLRAAQLVHAIRESLSDLPEPERLIDALTELDAQVAATLLRGQTTHENVVVIDAESWHDRTARAALVHSDQRSSSPTGRAVIDSID
ncbi:hypothetical protein HC028_21190 [Planosporangium flavigriseum]|uniref:Uncharacterized protein n=1 Tax=Planosporangium flavigriseum TaxID=373681 RepID=A0A8J3LJS7_9ACTN|nr:hypothetical protein [Planosporangium flavigriseum]NJC66999.1 hypothetical protein [Planosporangium flavigriseum]GIG73932.1 hypothetical protein Pfl04_23360 [Planosporangium flavigriseum]